MTEVAHSTFRDPQKAIQAFAESGREIVRNELKKREVQLSPVLLDSPNHQDGLGMGRFLRNLFKNLFHHTKRIGFSEMDESDLLSPIASDLGLRGSDEVFAFLAVLSGNSNVQLKMNHVLDKVVSGLLDYHLQAHFVQDEKQRYIEVNFCSLLSMSSIEIKQA